MLTSLQHKCVNRRVFKVRNSEKSADSDSDSDVRKALGRVDPKVDERQNGQTLNISYYTIISYHLPKNRYNIIYMISWNNWYDRLSYIIFLSFQKNLKLAFFYVLFINRQSSKHTKRRSQLSVIIFYSNNRHKLTSKRAVKSTQASNLWRGNLKLGQKWKMILK
jgi:hypothetical protein